MRDGDDGRAGQRPDELPAGVRAPVQRGPGTRPGDRLWLGSRWRYPFTPTGDHRLHSGRVVRPAADTTTSKIDWDRSAWPSCIEAKQLGSTISRECVRV